ncbi:MAG: GAF domain-containing protein [Alphaproteobacteria bacterium]
MMTDALDRAFDADLAEPANLGAVVRAFARALDVDRCFLYLRDPESLRAGVVVCWRRSEAVPDLPEAYLAGWWDEDRRIHTEDPMFADALAGHPAAFIADTEAAEAGVSPEVERKFSHRALVHVNLNADGRLWGILEPMTVAPRAWSAADRAVVAATRAALSPWAKDLVAAGPWPHASLRLVG